MAFVSLSIFDCFSSIKKYFLVFAFLFNLVVQLIYSAVKCYIMLPCRLCPVNVDYWEGFCPQIRAKSGPWPGPPRGPPGPPPGALVIAFGAKRGPKRGGVAEKYFSQVGRAGVPGNWAPGAGILPVVYIDRTRSVTTTR